MDEVTLPNEIWLEIFKGMDRATLMKLRLVCHQFYNLIEDFLNKDPTWKKLARKVILSEYLVPTMQRAHPYELVSRWKDIHDPVLWRGTYLCYKKWQNVLVNSYTVVSIVPTTNLGNISCIRTFDKYIAVGFDNGSIAIYTIDNISQPFYLTMHGIRIIQIEFWYSNGDVLVVSLGDDNVLKFWDLQNKIEIATNSFFANSINSGECRHFCIGDMGGILTSYERVGKQISPGPTHNLQLDQNQQVIAHANEGIHMTSISWSNGGTRQLRYEGVIEGGKLIGFLWICYINWSFLPPKFWASFQRLIIPTFKFFFGIAENSIGSIGTSNDYYSQTWNVHKLSHHFRCNVKSIALHAQILMFGLEDGSIHLLYIPHYDHVIELKYTIKNTKKIKVDTEPIIDLTIIEVNKKPCIVAATDQKVHLINFF